MKKKHGVFFGFAVLLITAIFTLAGCDNSGGDDIWLADLSNPFIGKWESDIPSANMHLIFDYKTDGTFEFELPDSTTGTGAYVVKDGIMVTYLDFEGTAAYRFKVVDNDTIDVTELEGQVEDDMWKWTNGDTAPFTRVSGSAINKENKPFVLTGGMVGRWASSGSYPLSAEVSIPFNGTYELNTNGTYIMSFEYQFPESYGGTQNEISKGVYSIIGNKILMYTYEDAPEDESPISLSTFTITGNTATTDTEGWIMNWTKQ